MLIKSGGRQARRIPGDVRKDEGISMAPTISTPGLLTRFREHVERKPAAQAYTFLNADGDAERTLTFGELNSTIHAVATALRSRLHSGDRVMLLLPEGLDFVPIFLACMQASVIPVPAYPPLPVQSRQRVAALRVIAKDCRPAAVVTAAPEHLVAEIRDVAPELANAWWVTVDTLTTIAPSDSLDDFIGPDQVAFLQYTSGSTALPKGVVVTHRALAHNEELIQVSMQHDENLTMVGWLPLFHDMGLIGNVLNPLWLGGHGVLMSPMAFIKRPVRWLRAISRYRGTTSGAPNFAYDMCAEKVRDVECANLDLSSWKVAYNGSEPVRSETLRAFVERFSPYGFDPIAFYPCYGLAEATLLVTGSHVDAEPRQVTVDNVALQRGKVVLSDTGKTLVSSGFARLDREAVIVDPDTFALVGSERVGEIWIGGPALPAGYWNNAQATASGFAARPAGSGDGQFMRSGDLGFVYDGELYVTGRLKDMIVIDGRNHYPHDIEATVEDTHEAIRRRCVAAFSVDDAETVRLIVVVGVGGGALGSGDEASRKRGEIIRAVRAAVCAEHGITVDDVAVVGPNAVPKTSSGKLQRGACRTAYLAGEHAIGVNEERKAK